MFENLPSAPERTGLSPQEIQDLIVAVYTEEQDKWKRDIVVMEQTLTDKEKRLQELECDKDPWWEKALKRKTNREKIIEVLKLEIEILSQSYYKRLSEAPRPEAYELAMLGGCIFKGK